MLIKRKLCIILCLLLIFTCVPAVAFAASKPAPPKGLKCTTLSTGSVNLSWKKVSKAKKYIVYKKSGSRYIKVSSPKKNKFTAKNLKPGNTYYFKVAVKTSKGTSKKSKAVKAYTKCTAPTQVKAVALSKTSIKLSWASTYGADKYLIYTAKSPAGTFWYAGATTGTQFTVGGLSQNTNYYFKLIAVNGTAKSNYSPTVSARTQNSEGIVEILPTGIKLDLKSGSSSYMPVSGGACSFVATIQPANANTQKTIVWTSSNTNVAAVSQTGTVTAKSVGTATITATTGNGKKATYPVKVAPDVIDIKYSTEAQPSGPVFYYMKLNDTIPMYLPKLYPADAYNVLTFESMNPDVAEVKKNSDGTYSIYGKAQGNSTIYAYTHTGAYMGFVIFVSSEMTNAQLTASSHTMDVNTYWTPGVNTVPAAVIYNGKSVPPYGSYTLSSSNTDILRVEQNKKVYAIKPGTANITVSIKGSVKSTCTVTVPAPTVAASGNPELKYYNVKYETNGGAGVSLGIVPVAGAASYLVTEHVSYNTSMTPTQLFAGSNIVTRSGDLKINGATVNRNGGLRQWFVSSSQAGSNLMFDGVSTGLRFFSVAAYSGPNCTGSTLGSTFVGRVPVLYYPRNVGGTSQANADGYILANAHTMWLLGVGGLMLPYTIPIPPYNINITFDKIPGAVGYDMYATCNGKAWGDDTILQPTAARCQKESGFVFDDGKTIINILPYVRDIDGTKLYGEMRTLEFDVKIENYESAKYWDSAATLASPILPITWK